LWWVVGGAPAALSLVVYWAPLRRLFGFAPVAAQEIALSFAVGVAGVLVFSATRALLTRMRFARSGS
jgi:hypothetical protein